MAVPVATADHCRPLAVVPVMVGGTNRAADAIWVATTETARAAAAKLRKHVLMDMMKVSK